MTEKCIEQVTIFTDGSCHTQQSLGAWVAILLFGSEKKVLSGMVPRTTHQRMEITAVIEAIKYARLNYGHISSILVISDSQYVVGLSARKAKFLARGEENPLLNTDLVKLLLDQLETGSVEIVKVKAHQKKTGITNYNIEADLLARKLVRGSLQGR